MRNRLNRRCLDGQIKRWLRPEDVRIITPEEYDEKYGDDDEEGTT